MVSNTKKWKSIDDKRTLKNDESEWIVVPNCHEAIVTEEEYKKAQSAIRKFREKSVWKPADYPIRSLIVCGVCGRSMSHYPRCKRKYYSCNISALDADTMCPIGEKFYEDDIEQIVVADLKEKLRLFVDNQKRIKDAEKATRGTETNIRANIAQTEKQLKQKSFERKAAYERYVDEIITKDEFLEIKVKLTADEEKLNTEPDRLQNELKALTARKNDSATHLAEKAEDFLSSESFTNEMLLYFIDKVKVYSGNKIEIVYRFQDVLESVPAIK